MFASFSCDARLGEVELKKEIKADGSWKDAPYCGAFSIEDEVRFSIYIPRSLGAYGAAFRINRDGEEYRDIQFCFSHIEGSRDVYEIELDIRSLCATDTAGLFFYEILILRGEKTLFTVTYNNHDFELKYHSEAKFSLLVYDKEFCAKEWFGKGVMYHVFVDRFASGEIKPYEREDMILNEDWYEGIPQYAEYPGAPLKNNMFFGGNLAGVCEKLDYIASLGTKVIYLSPIFKAYSNHKYDTGDYGVIDEGFGGEEAFCELIKRADEKGIKIILDGVFNHTGDDSRYFNRYGKYDSVGAYNDENSPYHDWFCFKSFPNEYDSWWGIEILPRLNQNNKECKDFFTAEGGIIEKYTKMGIGGWRLDVADELPDEFLCDLRKTAHESSNGEAIIIGEVWENAALKVAYGKRRSYFQGKQLDSVMNYPLRNGIVEFVKNGYAEGLYDALVGLYSSYPRFVCDSLMNILGTHDTERILTVLGEHYSPDRSNAELSILKMSEEEKAKAIKLLKIASILQYTAYGIPSVFYGDEAGLEGYHDPFCRRTFPWGRENGEILDHYKRLGEIRTIEPALDRGDFKVVDRGERSIAFERSRGDSTLLVAANRGNAVYPLVASGKWQDLISGEIFDGHIPVFEDSARILKKI